MLAVQEYLHGGKSLESLTSELGIAAYKHPTLPLVGLKYSQIDSPKTNPVVRDCRGIVLECDSWKVVAKPFRRFFNAGEDAENFQKFDWSDFTATSKEDGSLIILYHYANEWHVNTSGSFGLGECGFSGKTWRELFWEVSGIDTQRLDPSWTYLFEMWTPYNKVIRAYPKPSVFLLSAFHTGTLEELEPEHLDAEASKIGALAVEQMNFSGMEDIHSFLSRRSETDKTFEGVVIRDRYDERYKVKSKTYLALHHLFDNGNIFNPKRLVPLVLAGECDEVLAYLPEIKADLEKVKGIVDGEYDKLANLWKQTWQIEGQKEFAQAIVKETAFSGILFTLRKQVGKNQTERHLRDAWKGNADAIVNKLF